MSTSRTHDRGLLALALVSLTVLLLNWQWVASLQAKEHPNRAIDQADMPPALAVTSLALGPLKSLLANVLWWRATRMQQEDGNYFEAIQLAHWITTLEPKLYTVWTFQAWNMSYNIVADVPSPEERWRWIKASISLLRDEALRYNPNEVHIKSELARIYFQKMSGSTDPQSHYYAHQWALEMSRYLQHGDRAELEALAAAPADIVREPADLATLRATPGVATLLDAAGGLGLDLTQFAVVTQPKTWSEAQRTLVLAKEQATALAAIRAAVVRRQLLADLKLDAAHMLLIEQQYGPLDWRLPQAHVIYWGARESWDVFRMNPNYELGLVRQAMVQSFLQGKLTYLSEKDMYTTCNLAIASRIHDYLEFLLETRASDDVRNLAKDFHIYGAVVLYTFMHEAQARDVFKEFTDEFCTPEERKNLTFESFIPLVAPKLMTFGGSSLGGQGEKSLVVSSLLQAYVWLALGDPYRSKGYENTANMIWAQNQKTNEGHPQRLLPPLAELKKVALDQALSVDSGLPPEVQQTLRGLTGGKPIEIVTPTGKPEFLLFGAKHEKAAEAEQK